jgi:hypothetical protein
LQNKLKLPSSVSVLDIGYEVCFFRDAFHADPKLIKQRQQALEKQTFDLVLWLSDHSIVIIEAKAQQGFHMEQITALCESRQIMLDISVPVYRIKEIYLVGLCSSQYNLKKSTSREFNTIIRWNEVAELYPAHMKEYSRADEIYRDKLKDQ